MKNNKIWFWVILIVVICIGIGIYFFFKNKNSSDSNYSASKISANEQQNNTDNTFSENSENNVVNNSSTENNEIENNSSASNTQSEVQPSSGTQPPSETQTQKKEEVLASFSTKIYNKDSARQNNISITCSTLNNTIIKNGATFSFCNTVGPSTSAKGYQKADIFDKDGNKKKGLGGGNCQVSTTLYNAALNVSNLSVTERHEHSNKVPYIAQGKDAAVAYGSYDLKLKNNTGFDIKVVASSSKNNVSITLYKINF